MKTIYLKSPLGVIELYLKEKTLHEVKLNQSLKKLPKQNFSNFEAKLVQQFERYFQKKTSQIEYPTQLNGTDFQKKVWQQLCKIPYGKTQTYADVARAIGHPKAFRAVGQACNKNKLLLMVPCHRVVSSHGQLGGFALGLKAKKYLLDLEKEFLSSVSN